MGANEVPKVGGQVFQMHVKRLFRVTLQVTMEFCDRSFEQVGTPKLINYLFDFSFVPHLARR